MASADQTTTTKTMTEDADTDEADVDEETEQTLSRDDLFHILQNERRRQVLRYVINRDGPFEMRAIAEQVAAWEHDTTVRALTSDERQRVYIALYQSHLSTLDEAGLIEYQQSRGIVEVTELVEEVKPHIEGIEDEQPSEDAPETPAPGPAGYVAPGSETDGQGVTYFASATLFSLVLTGGVWANAVPLSLLNSVGLALIVIATFVVTALAHLWQGRSATDE